MKIQRVVFFVSRRAGAQTVAQDCASILQKAGISMYAPLRYSAPLALPDCVELVDDEQAVQNADLALVIGGDGTIHGARIFAQEYDIPCIAIPATIDNNLCGTDTTIGYDTALNTIMHCVDKIRDTASSHERLFFVEVLGDDAGFLALNGAIASGCEEAIIPTSETSGERLIGNVLNGFRKTKSSSIVLVAASEEYGGAIQYADIVKQQHPDLDVRISILGHLQRGGHPTAHDRIIASRMGSAAIEALLKGLRNVMIGIDNDEIVYVPFSRAVKENRRIDYDLLDILHDVAI